MSHDSSNKPERPEACHEDPAGEELATEPVFIFSREGVRQVDAAAVDEFAMPSIVLMENAARHLSEATSELLNEIEGGRVLILCGPGNNGGDGFALARHLSNAGAAVVVALTQPRDRYRGDAATNLEIIERMGLDPVEIDPADVVGSLAALPEVDLLVDALLGTGLDRPLTSPVSDVVDWINAQRQAGADRDMRVVSVDIPTGIDCDSGEVLGTAVAADLTVTFVGLKRGFCELEAQKYVGEMYIGDIGVPFELLERYGEEMLLSDRHEHDADLDDAWDDDAPDRPHDHRD